MLSLCLILGTKALSLFRSNGRGGTSPVARQTRGLNARSAPKVSDDRNFLNLMENYSDCWRRDLRGMKKRRGRLPLVELQRQNLKASILYRTASVLLALFAAGHTLGFRAVDPQWGVGSLISSMQSIHFDAMGSSRTYWDFYVGFGLFVSVFLVFAAVLSWQLAGLPAGTLAQMRGTAWALVLCFGAVTILSFRYFFIIPIACSIAILLCLTAAAWRSAKPT